MFRSVGFMADVEHLDVLDKQYCAITVLRLLKKCEEEDDKVNLIDTNKNKELPSYSHGMIHKLLDHNEDRRIEQPQIWEFEKEFIIDFIHKVQFISPPSKPKI